MSDILAAIISWDYKDQPDFEQINAELAEIPDARFFRVETGSDEYAMVIAPASTTQKQAQQHYDENR